MWSELPVPAFLFLDYLCPHNWINCFQRDIFIIKGVFNFRVTGASPTSVIPQGPVLRVRDNLVSSFSCTALQSSCSPFISHTVLQSSCSPFIPLFCSGTFIRLKHLSWKYCEITKSSALCFYLQCKSG